MSATLWVTNSCNMRCRYCYVDDKEASLFMSRKTADIAIDFVLKNYLPKDEALQIQFHGGEPLLNYSVIHYCTLKFIDLLKSNVEFSLTTNATLLTPEISDFLYKHFKRVAISIDGQEESHDKNRIFTPGMPTYQIVREKCKYLQDSGYDLIARMTITSDTCPNLSENVQHLIDLGFSTIEPVPDVTDPKWSEETAEIFESEFRKLVKMQVDMDDCVVIGGIKAARFRPRHGGCHGGKNSIHVAPDGKLYPCLLSVGKENYLVGDIYSGGINRDRVDKMLSMNDSRVETCEGCSRYDYCDSTRCKIVNEINSGHPDTPNPMMCKMTNIQYRMCQLYLSLTT